MSTTSSFGTQTFVVVKDEMKTINGKAGQQTVRELLLGKRRLYEMYQRQDGSVDTTRPVALDANGKPQNLRLFSFTDWQKSMGDIPQLTPGSRVTIECSEIYASVAAARSGQPARAFMQVEGEVVAHMSRGGGTVSYAAPASNFSTTRPKSLPQSQDGSLEVPAPADDDPMF